MRRVHLALYEGSFRMYTLKTNASFDSAHFLAGYEGKCSNIHGHHWTVEIEVGSNSLEMGGNNRGMIVDFSKLKTDLKFFYDEMKGKGYHVLKATVYETPNNCAAYME